MFFVLFFVRGERIRANIGPPAKGHLNGTKGWWADDGSTLYASLVAL